MRTTPLDRSMGRVTDRMIRRFGKAVRLWRPSFASFDPATSEVVKPEAVEEAFAVFQPLTGHAQAHYRAEPGTNVQTGDELAFIAAAALKGEPDASSRLEVGGRRLQVVSVQAIRSGERVALWQLHVRQ